MIGDNFEVHERLGSSKYLIYQSQASDNLREVKKGGNRLLLAWVQRGLSGAKKRLLIVMGIGPFYINNT
jgi:hypothetical protein